MSFPPPQIQSRPVPKVFEATTTTGIPANAILYDDGTPVTYDDGTIATYDS